MAHAHAGDRTQKLARQYCARRANRHCIAVVAAAAAAFGIDGCQVSLRRFDVLTYCPAQPVVARI